MQAGGKGAENTERDRLHGEENRQGRVEQALHEKLAKECQERMRCEIARLKQEQKRAERILCRYDEQLKQKMKQLKNCAGGSVCDD